MLTGEKGGIGKRQSKRPTKEWRLCREIFLVQLLQAMSTFCFLLSTNFNGENWPFIHALNSRTQHRENQLLLGQRVLWKEQVEINKSFMNF